MSHWVQTPQVNLRPKLLGDESQCTPVKSRPNYFVKLQRKRLPAAPADALKAAKVFCAGQQRGHAVQHIGR